MIEANAIALDCPAVSEITGGSTRRTVLHFWRGKRIIKQLDQRRFLFSILPLAAGIFANVCLTRFLPFGVRSHRGNPEFTGRGAFVLIFRIAQAYPWN